jgi:hypothetical protein
MYTRKIKTIPIKTKITIKMRTKAKAKVKVEAEEKEGAKVVTKKAQKILTMHEI